MITIPFLAEWAVRSAVLILGGALLLWALRVKGASIRLATWTAVLCASLAIPAMTAALPKMSFPVKQAAPTLVVSEPIDDAAPVSAIAVQESKKFDWMRAASILYMIGAGTLLLRIGTGLAMSLRMRRDSRATGQSTEGIEVRESERVASPVALGIVRPSILLPVDWREWDEAKLDAVLAHERSHIRRYDPAVQLLSAIHRSLLWFSPLSWFLHRSLVRAAEEASDDAAVESAGDRTLYARVLLEFMQRGVRSANRLGVPMARYERPDKRIHRILDETSVPHRITRWSIAAILALGLPLAYMASAARPIYAQAPAIAPVPPILAFATPAAAPEPESAYLSGLGAVTANTVTIKSRIDGQLMSVSFKEGDVVQAGQMLAIIDPRAYQLQLAEAEGQLARDQAQLAEVQFHKTELPAAQFASNVAQAEGNIKTGQATVDHAKLDLIYTQITSPITGVAGLLMVDPGNVVHTSDPTGIVVINQLRPISVLFTISEDSLPRVMARLKEGANLPAEAWSRDMKTKLATGRLTAVDNQIDTTTGTVKLKAVFENKDGALFPNQFVNVRLLFPSK